MAHETPHKRQPDTSENTTPCYIQSPFDVVAEPSDGWTFRDAWGKLPSFDTSAPQRDGRDDDVAALMIPAPVKLLER